MNLGELRTEIQTALSSRSDVTDARINSIINLAYKRIARYHFFKDLEGVSTLAIAYTGVPATDEYLSLSGNIADIDTRGIQIVTVLDSATVYPLAHVPTTKWRTMFTQPGRYASRRPAFYHVWGDRFELYPVPDQAYVATVYYRKKPVDLALDATSPTITTIDDAIINLALSWIYHSLRMHESGKQHWTIFTSALKESIEHDSENPSVAYEVGPKHSVNIGSEYWANPFFQG